MSIVGPVPGSPTKFIVMAGWDDAPHLSARVKEQMLASTPKHMRAARAQGVPVLGSGAVFGEVPDEAIQVDPFPIPAHWWQIAGMDFGWDHPTAVVRLAEDRDTGTFYVTAEHAQSEAKPLEHAAAIKPWGKWLPIAWPHDGLNETAVGPALAGQYRDLDLNMLAEHATHEDGGNSVEAGLLQMLDLMASGRWKVFKTCPKWLAEKRLYHRKDGKVVKLRDDVISASRYAYMMRRFAVQAPRPTGIRARPTNWKTA